MSIRSHQAASNDIPHSLLFNRRARKSPRASTHTHTHVTFSTSAGLHGRLVKGLFVLFCFRVYLRRVNCCFPCSLLCHYFFVNDRNACGSCESRRIVASIQGFANEISRRHIHLVTHARSVFSSPAWESTSMLSLSSPSLCPYSRPLVHFASAPFTRSYDAEAAGTGG